MENMENRNLELFQTVEEIFGGCPNTPKDFLCLSLDITKKTGRTVSVSTLKRIWGYICYYSNPSKQVLDTLSMFVGYDDYIDFCNGIKTESQILLSDNIIKVGDVISVTYKDETCLNMQYLGKSRFVIKR